MWRNKSLNNSNKVLKNFGNKTTFAQDFLIFKNKKNAMAENFNPNDFSIINNNFLGLPYTEDEAQIVLLPVPWEATVSYSAGTALGPNNILEASYQLDLMDWDVPNAWEIKMFMRPLDQEILELSNHSRELATQHIDNLIHNRPVQEDVLNEVNQNSVKVNNWVYQQTKELMAQGKFVGLVGGEHSTPFGYIKALSEKHSNFGILQVDAHADLREAFEDFKYSHASIFYNVLEEIPAVSKLVQVGIRDACQAEVDYAKNSNGRAQMFTMPSIRKSLYTQAKNYHEICQDIVNQLPQKVYISFDIDGLDPKLCPNTGTPVPEGFEFQEAIYLIRQVVASGRTIIGFDLSEVGSATEWDGNVGARVLHKLCLAATIK